MKICFGLTNVLCDINDLKYKPLTLRPGALSLLKMLTDSGHELILWTRKSKGQIGLLRGECPELFNYFKKVYCKEDIELWHNIPGFSMRQFKNIEDVQADLMIECKPIYQKYADNLNLGSRYIIIGDYREDFYKEPNSWKQKVLGEDTLDRWKERVAHIEDWVYDVLEKVERESKTRDKSS